MSFERIAEEVGHKSVLTTMQNYSYDTLDDLENRRILNSGLNIATAWDRKVNKLHRLLKSKKYRKCCIFSISDTFEVVARGGFEPSTLRVWTVCSSQLSYLAIWNWPVIQEWDLQGSNLWPSACKADALPAELRSLIRNINDPDRTRTDDLRRDRAAL